jgi:ABC-type bacteriocin/lantibiotic exporter with double-glycine peptidase domain
VVDPRRTSLIKATQNGLVSFLIWRSVGGITYYAGYLVLYPDLESRNILVLIMLLMLALMGASQVAGMIDDFKKVRLSAAKIFAICDLKPDVDRSDGVTMGDVQGKVEFRSIVSKYVSRDEYAIDGLSRSAPARRSPSSGNPDAARQPLFRFSSGSTRSRADPSSSTT